MKKRMTFEEYFHMRQVEKEKGKTIYKRGRFVFSLLCFSVFLFSLLTIFNWVFEHYKILQINREIDENIYLEKSGEKVVFINPPKDKNSDYYYYLKFPFYKVGFSIFKEKNPDTVGFIYLKKTNIHYPIVQSEDNEYYLKHDFNESRNNAGWIFMDYRNHIDELEDNVIIYGHARADGTMFGSLKNVLESSWQEERDNYVIFLSTLKENLLFQIFSIYTIQSESYYIQTSFSSKAQKQIWIDTMKKRNIAPIEVDVDVNDKILTLSTCKDTQGGRIVVHGKLIKKQKRE